MAKPDIIILGLHANGRLRSRYSHRVEAFLILSLSGSSEWFLKAFQLITIIWISLPVGGKLIRRVNLFWMALAHQLALLLLLYSASAFAGEGMTIQDYYRVNNIDPAAKAFVRVTNESVPQGCPLRATTMFQAEATAWKRLHESTLHKEPPASPDGHVTFQGKLVAGRIKEGMILSESVGAAALFAKVENRIRNLRYGKACQGALSVTVLFHQPSVPQ